MVWSDVKLKEYSYKINGLQNLINNQNSGTGILLFLNIHFTLSSSRILAMKFMVLKSITQKI